MSIAVAQQNYIEGAVSQFDQNYRIRNIQADGFVNQGGAVITLVNGSTVLALTAANANSTIFIPAIAGALAISLAAANTWPAGSRIRFVALATLGSAATITPNLAAGDTITGVVSSANTAVAKNSVANIAINAVATVGTTLELISTGAGGIDAWLIAQGVAVTAASFT